MAIILDGKEVKVGDKMYSLLHGEVEVSTVRDFIIVVEALKTKCLDSYWEDGKWIQSGDRILFWAKPDIVPPKPKVKKWQWFYKLECLPTFRLTEVLFSTEEEASCWLQNKHTMYATVLEPFLPSEVEE